MYRITTMPMWATRIRTRTKTNVDLDVLVIRHVVSKTMRTAYVTESSALNGRLGKGEEEKMIIGILP